jgi:hypothetical protein
LSDPTGCGDAYRAGLIYGLMRDMDLSTCGRMASLMGALKVEHPARRTSASHSLSLPTSSASSSGTRWTEPRSPHSTAIDADATGVSLFGTAASRRSVARVGRVGKVPGFAGG